MDDYCSCPDSSHIAYTRQGTRKRCDLKANTNRVSPTAWAPAMLCPSPVQATDVLQNKAVNDACAYVPTGGTMAEEAPESKTRV